MYVRTSPQEYGKFITQACSWFFIEALANSAILLETHLSIPDRSSICFETVQSPTDCFETLTENSI